MRRLLRMGRDLQRILQGTTAFFRYLRSQESIQVGLGLFAAASNIAVIGQPNRYKVRVANASQDSRNVILGIDIYAVDVPRHPEGHYGFFTKLLTVKSGSCSTIAIQYDWLTTACLLIDDLSSPPDDIWRGEARRPQRYSVTAALFDIQHTRLDALTIYQELTG
jgi:hypothetical protein